MIDLVYYSLSGNTKAFVDKLNLSVRRIVPESIHTEVARPFVLLAPTYSTGSGTRGSIAPFVTKFLNYQNNRNYIRGVIASGDRNFGVSYCHSGASVNRRFRVPILYQFELAGTPTDVSRVQEIISSWS